MNCIEKFHSMELARNTKGLSTVEYVIILCLLAVLGIGTWSKFGTAVQNKLKGATKDFSKEVKY